MLNITPVDNHHALLALDKHLNDIQKTYHSVFLELIEAVRTIESRVLALEHHATEDTCDMLCVGHSLDQGGQTDDCDDDYTFGPSEEDLRAISSGMCNDDDYDYLDDDMY